MKDASNWKTLAKKYVYEGRWFKVRQDEVVMPNGEKGVYDVVEKPDFVIVIPKTGDKFYLVEQDRYPMNARSLEFPQGSSEPGERPEIAAKRELEEETGVTAGKFTELGYLWLAAGHHTQAYTIFLAENIADGNKKLDDSEADMETKLLSEKDLKQKIKNGEIKDATTVAAFNLYLLNN